MEQDEDWDVISVEDIAAEFQITFLAEIIERGEKVNVNMGDVSGWFEEDGERFHFIADRTVPPVRRRCGIPTCALPYRHGGRPQGEGKLLHVQKV